MNPFSNYDTGRLIQLFSEARLTWDYQRVGELEYLREFALQNFFPIREHQEISSAQIKREHDRYKQATTELLEICPRFFEILQDWCRDNEQQNSTITDEMKKDRDIRYNDVIKKLQQQECPVMVFGDTGAGKSTLINTILEQDLMKTSAIKTTFAVCEIRYSSTKKYSIAETETSEFKERPFPSSLIAETTASNRYEFDYVRERYECPIDLLKGGIVIADSPGLNENETLTKVVRTYMADCLVFICVINRGVTDSLQNLLNELKSTGRTSARSIFFVVTNLDDKELIDQEKAINQIHSELKKLYEDYDFTNNCCMLNPAKAFQMYSKHHLYERAHYDFLRKFIPFLSNALTIKLEYLITELDNIFERLSETIQIKYNQSIMETHKCHEIEQRINMKKQKFDEAKSRIIAKTQSLSNKFNATVIDAILDKCHDRLFKDKLEKHALTINLPSENCTEQIIDTLRFEKQTNDEWCIRLTAEDAVKVFNKYALSLRTTASFFTPSKQKSSTAIYKHVISSIELCKIYLQHGLTAWIRREMTPMLEEQTKSAIGEIWKKCQDDLQTVDDEIMNDYQELMDEKGGRYSNRRIKERRNLLLKEITTSGGSFDFFTRTKLWFVIYTLDMPLHIESAIEWFKGMTSKEIRQNENGFKLKVAQQFYQRIIEKLKKQQTNLQEALKNAKTSETDSRAGAAALFANHSIHESRAIESDSIIDSVLKVFELVYTEIEQLAQTAQTQANAKQWEQICGQYILKVQPINNLFNNFRAIHLKAWPLKSNHVIREANILQLNFYEGCSMYNGKLINDNATSTPVHIRRLTDQFNGLDVYDECKRLAVTNNHQYILYCYGAYTEDSKIFITTEPIYLTLETFLSNISGNSLTTDKRIRLALELSQCIQYLHREKIEHCCIHPNSIMLTSDQHIKLNVVGNKENFLYIAPERLVPRRNTRLFAGDIYSFGLVLYRLFHTSSNEINLFYAGKWLFPTDSTDNKSVSKKHYADYVNQNYAVMKFRIPVISPETNDTVKDLIKACCCSAVQDRPDFNVVITMLSIEKLRIHNPLPSPLQNNQIKSYGLLSVDGGGGRGIIAAKIMEILEAKIGSPLWKSFDLAGGTSAGGLLILSSMRRRTPAVELTQLYLQLLSKIFPFSRQLPTTQYSHTTLEKELKRHFQELKLTATTSTKLFVVTKRSTDTQCYLLRNYDVTSTDNNSIYPGCSGWLCCDAARATTAAPTYFQPFVKDNVTYTDGGVGFNNPVQLVFDEALALLATNNYSFESTKTLDHFPFAYIASIGTGVMTSLAHASPPPTPILGTLSRVKNEIDLLIEQATECENAHMQMKRTCQRHKMPYFRFNPTLDERIRMDISDENVLNGLIELTNDYMNSESALGDIEKLCQLIKEKQE